MLGVVEAGLWASAWGNGPGAIPVPRPGMCPATATVDRLLLHARVIAGESSRP